MAFDTTEPLDLKAVRFTMEDVATWFAKAQIDPETDPEYPNRDLYSSHQQFMPIELTLAKARTERRYQTQGIPADEYKQMGDYQFYQILSTWFPELSDLDIGNLGEKSAPIAMGHLRELAAIDGDDSSISVLDSLTAKFHGFQNIDWQMGAFESDHKYYGCLRHIRVRAGVADSIVAKHGNSPDSTCADNLPN